MGENSNIDLEELGEDLEDLIAQSYFGYDSVDKIPTQDAGVFRQKFRDFTYLATNINQVLLNLENDSVTNIDRTVLNALIESPEVRGAFINSYAQLLYDSDQGEDESKAEGYKIYLAIDKYQKFLQKEKENSIDFSVEDQITEQINEMGNGDYAYKSDIKSLDTHKRVQDRLRIKSGKFRKDELPKPLQKWQCRVGASTFYVPPTSINVTQVFQTSSLGGAAIRQPNSPKMNMGHSETMVEMTIYFPTHESIWGFDGDSASLDFQNWDPLTNTDSDESETTGMTDKEIDKYLSSLRGLVTQFKYTPFLPVSNVYLNRTHDIDAVVLKGMTASTVQGFPHVIAVNLQLAKFNYTPFLPMINHFDQAIHWGKFRSFAGRGAIALDNKVNKGFLVSRDEIELPSGETLPEEVRYEKDHSLPHNKVRDIAEGKNFDLYFPEGTPSKIFVSDTTDFRQPGEDEAFGKDYWDGILSDLGFDFVDAPNFNFFEFDTKRESYTNERNVLRAWFEVNTMAWENLTSDAFNTFLDEAAQDALDDNILDDSNESAYRARLKNEWFSLIFDEILINDPMFQRVKEAREANQTDYVINEWEIPMRKLDIDWDRCVVKGVSVSLSNKFAKLQLQAQDEPTYQHIGGGDSSIDVEMIVIGDENLINIRRVFQHINGLARLERKHGVLGFLGIKNILTSLLGIKYILPLSIQVETIPNYPEVYSVKMSFVDFDVMQGLREKLDSKQQADIIKQFGKRNPFLRIKQSWAQTNCYGDFPLDIRDDEDKIIGHLDPDWYFRSFTRDNEDIVKWGTSGKVLTLIQEYAELEKAINKAQSNGSNTGADPYIRLAEITHTLEIMAQNKEIFPPGWEIKDGKVISLDESKIDDPEKREFRYYLGSYGEDQSNISILDQHPGGYFRLGHKSKDSKEVTYVGGLQVFSEDLASKNLKGFPHLTGTTGIADYQNEYIDGASNPNKQYEEMMRDWDYRNNTSRMLKAFPTYMLWLIDEGGQFAGMKLFDNLYGLNSVIDFSVVSSAENPMSDTLVLRLSNIYQRLTRTYNDNVIDPDDPNLNAGELSIQTIENRQKNLESGLFDNLVEIDGIRLKPGTRIHLRSGYGNSPNSLDTIFNGVIAEVQAGSVMTVIAQSDAVELSALVNSQSVKGSSGGIDGGLTNFWLSEPRDLMVRLLSMGSSRFKEWVALGSEGTMFSESKYGIRHFGNILYEPMSTTESKGLYNQTVSNASATNAPNNSNSGNGGGEIAGLLGEAVAGIGNVVSGSNLDSWGDTYSPVMMSLLKSLQINQSVKRDFEIFKRNIYPGNGTGIAQYMGGDLLDAGIIVTTAGTQYQEDSDDYQDPLAIKAAEEGDDKIVVKGYIPYDDEAIYDSKVQTVDQFWENYFAKVGITEEDLQTMLEGANTTAQGIDIDTSGYGVSDLFDDIVGNGLNILDAPGWLYDNTLGEFLEDIPILGTVDSFVYRMSLVALGSTSNLINVGGGILNGITRFSGSIGSILGLNQLVTDDDIAGFDEVSFRAQTYMKSIWDLFEVCAGLLPNYIVAVRPFEDRSTVFYGKPHWLYTSGVIPVTTGTRTDLQQQIKPLLEGSDKGLAALVTQANNSDQSMERLLNVSGSIGDLKDIKKMLANNIDPYDVGAVVNGQPIVSEATLQAIISAKKPEDSELNFSDIFNSEAIDYSLLTENEIAGLISLSEMKRTLNNNNDEDLMRDILKEVGLPDALNEEGLYRDSLTDVFLNYSKRRTSGSSASVNQTNYTRVVKSYISYRNSLDKSFYTNEFDSDDNYNELIKQIEADKTLDDKAESGMKILLERDPVTFAYQFGWRYSKVPAWIGPQAGAGYDTVGELARSKYSQDASVIEDVIAGNEGRNDEDARDIWDDFRATFRYMLPIQEVYSRLFPQPGDKKQFDTTTDAFLRFLWQDPYNRAWLVIIASRYQEGMDTAWYKADVWNPWADNPTKWKATDFYTGKTFDISVGENRWIFGPNLYGAWETFLASADLSFQNGVPRSGATKAYMKSNAHQGTSAGNVLTGSIEGLSDWYDQNIGQVMSLVVDSVSGLVASIKMSLLQMSTSLELGGQMQRYSNILNSSLNDSIYYQMGEPDSLLRRVDNPFTREYGEPVVEIREPFQRVHMLSSFEHILSNRISENLTDVATTITAVSDGKNPVTVHLDKGVSPERQVEKIVETGVYWDNAVGKGFFGFLQPLISPLESLRAVNKNLTGSSDEITSRRIALYHLKNSLKKLYTGELIVMGDASIRPWDLMYISDIQERMYGMTEVGQVIHHFNPETGFTTSLTPSIMVSINDPGRWTMTSYMWNKMTNSSMRDEMRALMGIKTERFISSESNKYLHSEDLFSEMSDHVNGSVQWTQGNTALIRDMGAVFAGGGIKGLTQRDEELNKIMRLDIGLGATKAVAPVVAGVGATLIGSPLAGVAAAAGTWAIADLAWDAWQWIKEELLDVQGCYIQFLNKDGQAMDAGLSYFEGSAVGANHTASLFPSVFGLIDEVEVAKNGHYRITTNDLLNKLGWTEVETTALFKEVSMFVNETNVEVLKLSGRGDFSAITNDDHLVFTCRILRQSEDIGNNEIMSGITDGDTIKVKIIDPGNSGFAALSIKKVRLSLINTAEVQYKDNAYTDYDELQLNAETDLGRLATEYLINKYSGDNQFNQVAIRVRTDEIFDSYDRVIGTIFHNAPIGLGASDRIDFLKDSAMNNPPLPVHSYLDDGRPRTLNWEMVMTGYGNVDMRDSLWDQPWHTNANDEF
jgi:hypothetical protein